MQFIRDFGLLVTRLLSMVKHRVSGGYPLAGTLPASDQLRSQAEGKSELSPLGDLCPRVQIP